MAKAAVQGTRDSKKEALDNEGNKQISPGIDANVVGPLLVLSDRLKSLAKGGIRNHPKYYKTNSSYNQREIVVGAYRQQKVRRPYTGNTVIAPSPSRFGNGF